MKKYWFHGIMPKDAISEDTLTEKQKEIIEEEKEKLTKENLQGGWLGFNRGEKWSFMRHGFEEIIIDESRGNIARKELEKLLPEIYIF